ncbi:MAG: 6-phosphofructokinase, partial [Gemmatimonadetes bacterium]|nr:6-phosphofructokinase [Gemmatimonadota bacterium]
DFPNRPISIDDIVRALEGAIIKRLSRGRPDGVAVIAEGVVLGLANERFQLDHVERDEHGHIRLAEVDVGGILRKCVKARLAEFGIGATIVDKDIGYELRCADPIPYDLEYTRDLGFCASRSLQEGRDSVMVTMQGGRFVPLPLRELLDPETGRMGVRMVDTEATRYTIARKYMIRLRRSDFEEPKALEVLASACGVSPREFRREFGHVVAS